MTNIPVIQEPKAVYDRIDYGFTHTKWLRGDTISASSWNVYLLDIEGEPGEETTDLVMDSPFFTNTVAGVWLSAGVQGTTYLVVNRITTLGGRSRELGQILQVI